MSFPHINNTRISGLEQTKETLFVEKKHDMALDCDKEY